MTIRTKGTEAKHIAQTLIQDMAKEKFRLDADSKPHVNNLDQKNAQESKPQAKPSGSSNKDES